MKIINDWLVFCLFTVVTLFLFLDEEPLFDPTDWNIIHVILLLLSLMIVVWENVIRAKYGQFVFKDQVLLFATFSFWFGIENYFRIIVIVFCLHCLTPLEIELVDTFESFQTLITWYTTNILPSILMLTFVLFLTILTNNIINWNSGRLVITNLVIILSIMYGTLLLLLWDFISSALTSVNFSANPKQFYTHSRATLSYNMSYLVEDTFDWHKEQPQTFVMRFEDLLLFYLQFFNIIALWSCIIAWSFLVHDCLDEKTPSYLFLGVCHRWLDHALWGFFYSNIIVATISFRLWLRVSPELSIWLL